MMIDNKLYNPAGQPKEWLIEHFVVRTKVFEKIFKDIRQGTMKYPEQHYLIQGQRGMGKTTLLLRLKYEIENTPELNSWLVPVFFNEESYDLTSLSNLWEKLFKYLDDAWQTGGTYYKQTDAFVGLPDYEKLCFNLLLDILHTEKKKLVIFFDNFGQLFLDNLSGKEQHRFREILMHNADIRIIGASAVVLQDLHDYSKPFFEFFKIINLEGLNKDETVELIRKLEEKSEKPIDLEKNKAKIETLAILTGGVIRTVMLIYEVILADQDGSALRDLEAILDRITPLYKHRIEDLPVQQRKIVDVIAKKWDAISTKEIAENIRENGKPMETKLISAQLQQLEKNNVIEKKQTNTKNHLYQLNERFFNIWYLMRNGDRNDKCKVIWLTKFLELWYEDENALEEFIINHISHLQSGKYHAYSAIMMAEALSRLPKLDLKIQEDLIKETANILNEAQSIYLPKIHLDIVREVVELFELNKYEAVLKITEKIEQKDPILAWLHHASKAIVNKAVGTILKSSFYVLGKAYQHYFNNNSKALEYYLKFHDSEENTLYGEISEIYCEMQDFVKAEKYLLEGIAKGETFLQEKLADLYFFNLNDIRKAKEIVINALLSEPNNSHLLMLRGIILLSEHQYNEAKFDLINSTVVSKENYTVENYVSSVLLTLFYFGEKNKTEALKSIGIFQDDEIPQNSSILFFCKALVSIWDDNFTSGFEYSEKYFQSDYLQEPFSSITDLLPLLLLSKKQYHFTHKLFQNEKFNLKERLKPIYYALMHYMKDEYPNEYLRMGEELKQPVEDVMKKVEEMAVDYA